MKIRRPSSRPTTAVALAAAAVMALSACGGSSAGGSSSDPVVIGSVNALSGAATFAEASRAAEAVFARANEDGGLGGRQIDYRIEDDKGDPATAASAARQLVGSDGAVALVGGASLVDCQINAAYYEQQEVLSVAGTGVDATCFSSPNIAPVNVGPFNDLTLSLIYGTEELGLTNVCALIAVAGNTLPSYEAAIETWSTATGKELVYSDYTVPYGASDYTPYIVKARQAGCQALAINAVEPDAIGLLKAAEGQGWDDVTWLGLTSVYSEQFAQAATSTGAGMYVPAEFYPFTDEASDITADWRELMTANDIPLTSFSQGGYLAATYFLEVAGGIEGDITRESVTTALQEMAPIEEPMVGTPYLFGTAEQHDQNSAGWPVKLVGGTGAWETAGDDWLRIPAS